MNKNSNLHKAKEKKKDEFYTQLSDIENELRHYKQHFRGKVVYCNCDDPYESNFFKFFALNFNLLGLKKLIVTGYSTSPVIGTDFNVWTKEETDVTERTPYVAYINEVTDLNGDGRIDLEDVKIILKEKHNCRRKLSPEIVYVDGRRIVYKAGDFRSPFGIRLLKQADIVVTNPPFSLFREYVAQLMKYGKKFLIIGNKNAANYKEFFPLLKDNKVWYGYTRPNKFKNAIGEITSQVQGLPRWFTNLEIKKRHEDLVLFKQYNPEDYPVYYNYDAIDVSDVCNIPYDYDGVMGVPITFFDNYNPEQFEIIGLGSEVPKTKLHVAYKDRGIICYEVDGKPVWTTPYTVNERKIGNSLRIERDGLPSKAPYGRILIRKRKSVVSE